MLDDNMPWSVMAPVQCQGCPGGGAGLPWPLPSCCGSSSSTPSSMTLKSPRPPSDDNWEFGVPDD